MRFKLSERGQADVELAISVAFLVIFYIIAGVVGGINKVTEEKAVARFAELAEVETSQIEVIRHSNNNQWWFGDSHDVTFEMEITYDGADKPDPISGRCTSGVFSPMICRLYGAGGD